MCLTLGISLSVSLSSFSVSLSSSLCSTSYFDLSSCFFLTFSLFLSFSLSFSHCSQIHNYSVCRQHSPVLEIKSDFSQNREKSRSAYCSQVTSKSRLLESDLEIGNEQKWDEPKPDTLLNLSQNPLGSSPLYLIPTAELLFES